MKTYIQRILKRFPSKAKLEYELIVYIWCGPGPLEVERVEKYDAFFFVFLSKVFFVKILPNN